MAATLSPHSRFMAWVNLGLKAKRRSYYEDANSEAEEEEVLELLLPVRLRPTRPKRTPLRRATTRKGKERINEEDVHEDKRDTKKVDKKRKKSEESNNEIDAGGSASTKRHLRQIKRSSSTQGTPASPAAASFPGTRSDSKDERWHRTTLQQSFSSPSSSSLLAKPDISLASAPAIPISIPETASKGPIQNPPLINFGMDEYGVHMDEDDFHSSDSEPGGYLANGRRRRRELERARTRDEGAPRPAIPLPASTVCEYPDSSRETSESHFRRTREKRWMSREFHEYGGPVPSEGGPIRPPQFIKRSAALPKWGPYINPRNLSGPPSKPISDVSVTYDPCPAVD